MHFVCILSFNKTFTLPPQTCCGENRDVKFCPCHTDRECSFRKDHRGRGTGVDSWWRAGFRWHERWEGVPKWRNFVHQESRGRNVQYEFGRQWVDQFSWSGRWLAEELRLNSCLGSDCGQDSNARAQKMGGPWPSESLQICFVFCALVLWIFFSSLSLMFNIWGSNIKIQISVNTGIAYFIVKNEEYLCLTYKVFLVCIGLYFSAWHL